MAINLVVFGLLSLRGVERTFCLFSKWFNSGEPCHVVVQNWVLRLGLYKLNKMPIKRNDWIYVLDHTIEYGTKKCLVILGVSLKAFRKNKCKLQHKDVEVLSIRIDDSATAQTVTEALREVKNKTGIPVQIVSDNGSNIKKGVNDFIAETASEENKITQTYDVTHKVGLILKDYLQNDERWKLFVKQTSYAKQCLVHTPLAYASPPKPNENKARWLNLDIYLNWANMILSIDTDSLSKAEHKKYNDKLLWVNDFKKDIFEWRSILTLLQTLKIEIKNNGFSQKTIKNFNDSISEIDLNTIRLKGIKVSVVKYLQKECMNLTESYLGCSDIIESIFGKYKVFSGKSPMREIGKAILTIPVFTGSFDSNEVKKAMEEISSQDVNKWLADNIGISLFSKRKKAFKNSEKISSVKKVS